MNENKAEASTVWHDWQTEDLAAAIYDFLVDYGDDPSIALVTAHARQLAMAIRQAPTKQ